VTHIFYFNLWKRKADCFKATLPERYRPDKGH